MPELPDLTVFAANLTSRVKGKKVNSVNYYRAKRLNVTPEKLQQSISNNTIEGINRSGKEIELVFSNGERLFVHLMLAGEFSIVKDVRTIQFKVLSLVFDDDVLVISDPKGLVTLNLNPVPSKVPDALDVDTEYMQKKIAEKPRTIAKAFLIDQGIIRGIGNAYADEILWQSKISPRSTMGKLPAKVVDEMLVATKTVLSNAIEQIKIINPEIISGEIRDFLSVHHPGRQKSPTGHKIIKEQIASKTTYYTDEQVLYS